MGARPSNAFIMETYNTGSALLAYKSFGSENGLPIVFLHGATLDHVSMKNTFERYFHGLDREYRRIYVDLPGHGESGHSFFRANMTDLLEDVGNFLLDNFKHPPRLVGYSMGGFMALKLAEKTPFPAIFLIAPPIYTNKDTVAKPLEMVPPLDELTEDEKNSADRRYLRLAAKRTSVTLQRYRANLVTGFSIGKWIYQTKLFRSAAEENLTIDPCRIMSGATFLVGRRDLLVGYRDQFELSSKLKSSEYHSFSDCGHFLPVECSQFEGIFRNWLNTAVNKS